VSIGPAGQADAGAFLVRLLRLDPAALVRLRPSARDAGHTEIWAMLPFGVLATRMLPVGLDGDRTVRASELFATLDDPAAGDPRRHDEQWRWPLPPSRGQAVDQLPAGEVARLALAASRTLREAASHGVGGRVLGERVIRDALLDHIPIVVTGYSGERVDVPQRVVQAVVRMGFLGDGSADSSTSVTFGEKLVTVRLAVGWIGLDASYGCAWYRPSSPMRIS
jgi:hypothetical protein